MKQHKNEAPHILKFYGTYFDKEKKKAHFMTEYISGGSLYDYMKKNTNIITIDIIIEWSVQILTGLQFLHESNIIHRDIKLDNIFIDESTNYICLGDYGLAFYIKKSDDTKNQLFPNDTQGTPNYMAPEIFLKQSYDTKVDMYAFGMCLLEMLTLEQPYRECVNEYENYIVCVEGKVTKGILPESIYNLPEKCVEFIKKLLSFDPTERPDVFECLNTIDSFCK